MFPDADSLRRDTTPPPPLRQCLRRGSCHFNDTLPIAFAERNRWRGPSADARKIKEKKSEFNAVVLPFISSLSLSSFSRTMSRWSDITLEMPADIPSSFEKKKFVFEN